MVHNFSIFVFNDLLDDTKGVKTTENMAMQLRLLAQAALREGVKGAMLRPQPAMAGT